MITWRTPLKIMLLPVTRLTAAPTAKSATKASTSAPMNAVWPRVIRNGRSGIEAPIENVTNEYSAAPHDEPSSVGIETELLAHFRVERLLRIGHQARGNRFASALRTGPWRI